MILVGAFYVNPANWVPFAPYGYAGLSFFGFGASVPSDFNSAETSPPLRDR